MTGHDATGSLAVTLDAGNRVSHLTLLAVPDVLRQPASLAAAVDHAFRQAILLRLRSSRRHRPGPGALTAREPRRPAVDRPAPDLRPGRGPSETVLRAGTAPPDHDLTPVGVSDNTCVTVTLDAAGSNGRVEAEPGWLAQASAAHISSALLQAFRAAYERRDRR